MSPDQLRLDGFEEGFHRSVVIAISFATHRGFEAMLSQEFLVIVRAILAGNVRNSVYGDWPMRLKRIIC